MAQGSSWNPKKANVFADKIATAGADVKKDVPKILERRDNTICYADDLLSAPLKMATAQTLFEKIEEASLEDGADISYKKTVLKVLGLDKSRQRKGTWHLVGKKGRIHEDIEQFVLYLGFWVQAFGFGKHVEMCIQKACQAQAVLMDILLQFPLVGLTLWANTVQRR